MQKQPKWNDLQFWSNNFTVFVCLPSKLNQILSNPNICIKKSQIGTELESYFYSIFYLHSNA